MLKIALWEGVLVRKGAKHAQQSSWGKPELEMIQDMYIHKALADCLPPVFQVFICCELVNCIVVSSKIKFFHPAKNVTSELRKMGLPRKSRWMYKKE